MAKCTRCGKRGLFLKLTDGLCPDCLSVKKLAEEILAEQAKDPFFQAWHDQEHQDYLREYYALIEEIESDYSVFINGMGGENAGEKLEEKCLRGMMLFTALVQSWQKYQRQIPPSSPPFKRLSMLREKKGDYIGAAMVCIQQMRLGAFGDSTKAGMRGRLARLIKRGKLENDQEIMAEAMKFLQPSTAEEIPVAEAEEENQTETEVFPPDAMEEPPEKPLPHERAEDGNLHSFLEDSRAQKKRVAKYNRTLYGIVLLGFLEAVFLMFSITGVIAAPPLGIVCLVGCFFFFQKVFLKVWKRARALRTEIKGFQGKYGKPSLNIHGDTTYCFLAPFSYEETCEKICEALASIGEMKNTDSLHGTITGKIRVNSGKKAKVVFFVERNDTQCKVRAIFKKVANDDWWDIFLRSLFSCSQGVDYGVSLAKGAPQLAGVLHLGDGTQQVSFSKTKGGTSLSGFLIGGALFGDAGAIVGGLSGKQRTVTHSTTVFSDALLVRIIYNNGRLWEGKVSKGSPLYHEILVNA